MKRINYILFFLVCFSFFKVNCFAALDGQEMSDGDNVTVASEDVKDSQDKKALKKQKKAEKKKAKKEKKAKKKETKKAKK